MKSHKSGNFWTLCAIVVNPHGEDESILSVVFHLEMKSLLTTGTDCKFKFWRATVLGINAEGGKKNKRRTSPDPNKASVSWRCELTGLYRGEICRCASFSSDGSMLAMGCGSVVALWEVKNY